MPLDAILLGGIIALALWLLLMDRIGIAFGLYGPGGRGRKKA
jgi:hypothetical protein